MIFGKTYTLLVSLLIAIFTASAATMPEQVTSCSICLAAIAQPFTLHATEKNKAYRHTFCKACIATWAQAKVDSRVNNYPDIGCPLCKKQLDGSELKALGIKVKPLQKNQERQAREAATLQPAPRLSWFDALFGFEPRLERTHLEQGGRFQPLL